MRQGYNWWCIGLTSCFVVLSCLAAGIAPPHAAAITNGTTLVDLSSAFNNTGITDDATRAGNFDGSSNTYSKQALQAVGLTSGTTATLNGVPFSWPASDTANNIASSVATTVAVSTTLGATTLAVIGSGTGGTATGSLIVTYADATTQTVPITLNEWGTPIPAAGTTIATAPAYFNQPGASNVGSMRTLTFVEGAIDPTKIVSSIQIPQASNGQLHIFAITLENGRIGSPFTSLFNNVGSTTDANKSYGNFDGSRDMYSSDALTSAGLTPGGTPSSHGVSFTAWGQTTIANNILASGQIISDTMPTTNTTLAFLGSGSNSAISGTGTLRFTDGTTTTFSLGFSDWTSGGTTPSFGNSTAFTATYYLNNNGSVNAAAYIFYQAITLPAGKTLSTITLPTITTGQMHLFALSLPASITLSLSSGMPTSAFTVTGTGFGASTAMTLTWDTGATTLLTTTTASSGAFTITPTVPGAAPLGTHTVIATDATGATASAVYTVSGGALSLSLPSSITGPTPTLNGRQQTLTIPLSTITMTDTRATGAGGLSLQVTDLSTSSHTLGFSSMTVAPSAATMLAALSSAPSGLSLASTSALTGTDTTPGTTHSSAFTLMQAPNAQGMGSYTTAPTLSLPLPANAYSGAYTADLIISLQ